MTAIRDADFWERLSRRRVACTLCYRSCELQPGEAGWCKLRANDAGHLAIKTAFYAAIRPGM